MGNDLFASAASLSRILGPVRNAFERYDELLKQATRHPKNVLYLLALGPTATVLAFDLARDGYQALDIGHIDIEYEWFLRRVSDKVPIRGKYVNEARGGHRVDDRFADSDYRRQVVARIV